MSGEGTGKQLYREGQKNNLTIGCVPPDQDLLPGLTDGKLGHSHEAADQEMPEF